MTIFNSYVKLPEGTGLGNLRVPDWGYILILGNGIILVRIHVLRIHFQVITETGTWDVSKHVIY
jgi:hypothetical protein